MTEKQEEVIEQIRKLLVEHFEAGVVVASAEDDNGYISTMAYAGGLMGAIGLLRAAERKMAERQAETLVLRGEEDEEE